MLFQLSHWSLGELVKCDVIIGGQPDVTVCDRGREGSKMPKMRDIIIE